MLLRPASSVLFWFIAVKKSLADNSTTTFPQAPPKRGFFHGWFDVGSD
jgi:hypothetical protein